MLCRNCLVHLVNKMWTWFSSNASTTKSSSPTLNDVESIELAAALLDYYSGESWSEYTINVLTPFAPIARERIQVTCTDNECGIYIDGTPVGVHFRFMECDPTTGEHACCTVLFEDGRATTHVFTEWSDDSPIVVHNPDTRAWAHYSPTTGDLWRIDRIQDNGQAKTFGWANGTLNEEMASRLKVTLPEMFATHSKILGGPVE